MLGWAGLARAGAVVAHVPAAGLALLALGGVVYTLGAPVHRLTRLRYHDAIWHGSVLAAAACHFAAVALWLLA